MLSFNECKNILNNNCKEYTDQQVKEINEFAEMMAEIIINNNLLDRFKKERHE
jgi:hypothetical protein